MNEKTSEIVTRGSLDFTRLVFKFEYYMGKSLSEYRMPKPEVELLIEALNNVITSYVLLQGISSEDVMQVVSYAVTLYSNGKTDKIHKTVDRCVEIFARKQHDYGPNNIARFGELGIIVRLTDKLERLNHLKGKDALNESIYDTYADIANYCTIMLLVLNDEWQITCKHYRIVSDSEQHENSKSAGKYKENLTLNASESDNVLD